MAVSKIYNREKKKISQIFVKDRKNDNIFINVNQKMFERY